MARPWSRPHGTTEVVPATGKEATADLTAVIDRKRQGESHTRDEIEAIVRGYTSGALGDADAGSWLRAVLAHGLSDDETAWLTQAMASSGEVLSWSGEPGVVVDKHSTGGVGDDVSLIAVPLAAACGVKVAKLSGRALGHTGGTIDKLECVPGLHTHLSAAAFQRQVRSVGCAIAEATDRIAPADRKFYALRHRTNTIASIGLITASVLSKKIAGGAPYIVVDVKCGRCAFMQTEEEARALATSIVEVGRRCGRSITALVTDMDAPLARSIGDALELEEALGVLAGRKDGRLREVALAVAEAMLAIQYGDDRSAAPKRRAALEHALQDGSAYRCFVEMTEAQGGDLKAFAPPTQPALTVDAPRGGFITEVEGRAIGHAIAAHRSHGVRPEGMVLHNLGVRLRKMEGDQIEKGEPIAEIFGDRQVDDLAAAVRNAIRVGSAPPPMRPLVIARFHDQPS